MEMALEISGLGKQYRDSDFILHDVMFSVPRGAIMGFVGENGSGKTTTISAILNTIAKDKGTVHVLGKEMTDETTALREDIGVVFDATNFSENLTAKQLAKVMEGVYVQWNAAYYNTLLKQFGLPQGRKLKTFSRGMLMKLAIAVALSHDPKLLILDEATAGLDPIVRDEILDVFLGFVGDESHAILLSSHITTDLEKIADYITFLHRGTTLMTVKKDDILYRYGVARCSAQQFAAMDAKDIVSFRKKDYQIDVLVQDKAAVQAKYNGLMVDGLTIDEMMLLLVKGEKRI